MSHTAWNERVASAARFNRNLVSASLYIDVHLTMDQKLAQYASLAQRDKAPAYLSLLSEVIERPDQSGIIGDVYKLVNTVVNQDSVGLVASRQVLAELVKVLGEGKISDADTCKQIIQDTLRVVETRQNSYDEQVCELIMRIEPPLMLVML
jgi:COP9 signalosome complex subunit 4